MVQHNLEADVSRFIGRERELSSIEDLLARHRLVTLTGVGGVGKTRLAAQVARRTVAARRPADGVWWIDLGAQTDSDDLALACLKALRIRPEPDREALTTLVNRLAQQQLMVCLDTCEHVLDQAAGLADRLLRAIPGLTVLATSREPLAIDGEAVCRVGSLNPTDATELFRSRARLVSDDPGDGDTVSTICDRIDRLPLAIELAAAWTRALTPHQLLTDLDDRFRLLAGGPRRAVPRHRALHASMTWSHELLAEPERVLFRRLSVFAGAFDLAGATMVAAPDSDEGVVLVLLARLVDTSFVVASGVDSELRYRLLDTVREYGEERLDAAGELAETRDRHLEWCTQEAERIASGINAHQDRWLPRARLLGDNVKAALEWGIQDTPHRAAAARRLAGAMVMPWFLSGRTPEALTLIPRVLELPAEDAQHQQLVSGLALVQMITQPPWESGPIQIRDFTDPVAAGRAALVGAFRAFFTDREQFESLAREAEPLWERAGDAFIRDFSRIMAAYTLIARDRYDEACAAVQPALENSRARADRFRVGFATGVLQFAAMQTGQLDRADALGRAMVETVEPLGDYFAIGTLTSNLALAMCLAGEPAGARSLMGPIVASIDTAPDVDVVGFQVAMGQASLEEGKWEESVQWFRRGLARLDHTDADWTAARCTAGTIEALRRLGRIDEAQTLLGRGRHLAEVFDSPQLRADLDTQEAFMVGDDAQAYDLHHRALEVRRAAGLRTYLPDSLDALAPLQARGDNPQAAVRTLAAGTTARTAIGRPRSAVDEEAYLKLVEQLQTSLGEDYRAAWAEGVALTLDQAVAMVQRGRGSRDRPRTGWASLTPAEAEVVALVVEGLSNVAIGEQLFMSRSTVKTHLAHIFAKVGVGNRTELAVAAAEANALEGPDR